MKYEDIVLNFEKSVQKVLDFLELPWSNDVLEFYKKAQNRKRISSSKLTINGRSFAIKLANRLVKNKTKKILADQ